MHSSSFADFLLMVPRPLSYTGDRFPKLEEINHDLSRQEHHHQNHLELGMHRLPLEVAPASFPPLLQGGGGAKSNAPLHNRSRAKSNAPLHNHLRTTRPLTSLDEKEDYRSATPTASWPNLVRRSMPSRHKTSTLELARRTDLGARPGVRLSTADGTETTLTRLLIRRIR